MPLPNLASIANISVINYKIWKILCNCDRSALVLWTGGGGGTRSAYLPQPECFQVGSGGSTAEAGTIVSCGPLWPLRSASSARNHPFQLRVAKTAVFSIPRHVISASPELNPVLWNQHRKSSTWQPLPTSAF